MNKHSIAVTSDSFSLDPYLREKILHYFPNAKFKQDRKKFSKSELIDYLKGCSGAIIGLEKIDDEILSMLPDLRIISKYGVGTDNLDLEAMKARNITLGWTPGLNKNSVSELAVAQMISLSRNLFVSGMRLKNGVWHKDGGRDLSELKVGILGVGFVGKEMVKKLKSFGCELLASDIGNVDSFLREHNVKKVSLEELFKNSDIVSIHIPMEPATRNLVNEKLLSLMKKGSMIVNTARGGIVDEDALYEALKSHHLYAAAMDVFLEEPAVGSKLMSLENFVPTPHIAGNSKSAVKAMGESAISHLVQFFEAEK